MKLPPHGFYADVNSREGLKLYTHRGSSATLHGLNTLWVSSCYRSNNCRWRNFTNWIVATVASYYSAMLEFGELFRMTHSLTNACKQCFLLKNSNVSHIAHYFSSSLNQSKEFITPLDMLLPCYSVKWREMQSHN